jgi:hypothetical protein
VLVRVMHSLGCHLPNEFDLRTGSISAAASLLHQAGRLRRTSYRNNTSDRARLLVGGNDAQMIETSGGLCFSPKPFQVRFARPLTKINKFYCYRTIEALRRVNEARSREGNPGSLLPARRLEFPPRILNKP